MTKTNKAWEKLFNSFNIIEKILTEGYYVIEAKDIRKEREPRLMAKFDHEENLPEIFKQNDLSILPITRSKYILGNFKAYQKIHYKMTKDPKIVYLPKDITTIDTTNLYSESAALHCAFVTGMIDDLIGEKTIQTVSGRMSSKTIDFEVATRNGTMKKIKVENSQIEIDGGYESKEHFCIIEAKKETVEDFLIRQLYYPYRLWNQKTRKKVIPIFFTYSNDIFSFFVFKFNNEFQYNSIELIEQKHYMIEHEKIELNDLIDISNNVSVINDNAFPFPQANSFERIVDLLSLLIESELDKETIALNYNFNIRQTFYYTSACIFLGLIEKEIDENDVRNTVYRLTDKGREIMKQPFKEKYLGLAGTILSHQVFNDTFQEFLLNDKVPNPNKIVEILRGANIENLNSESTYLRRASTVSSWVRWILKLTSK